MGLGKWWMTYGPGSVGSVAKTIAKCYKRHRDLTPVASEDELVRMTLLGRLQAHTIIGSYDFGETEEEQANMIEEIIKRAKVRGDVIDVLCIAKGLKKLNTLGKVILEVIHVENPVIEEVRFTKPNIYADILDIIGKTTDKYGK